jgi:hypothetical protein
MTVSGSGLFAESIKGMLDGTVSLSWTAATNRAALFTNAITPVFDAPLSEIGYGTGEYAAHEVSGAGYAAGGTLLGSTTISVGSGAVIFDAADVVWPLATFDGCRAVFIYDPLIVGKYGFMVVDLGADYEVINGQFRIEWHTSGIAAIDTAP